MNITQMPNLSSLRVTNSYAQKKKDSVPAALFQRHSLDQVTNCPDYIGLASRLPNIIGLPLRLPDDIGLVQYFPSSIGGWDLNRINNIYSVQHHNLVNDIHSVDCLVLRCLRLISALAAVIKKPAVLSPSIFNASISSKSSKGSLTDTCSDLLFFLPVAITGSPSYRWCSVYTKLFHEKILTWCSPLNILVVFTSDFIGNRNSNAPKCANTTEAFNHSVMESYDMAMYKSTQTHPKFLWRFFSCQQSKYFSVEATSEQEARSMLPDSPCLFSARIRQRDDLNSHALRLAIVVQGGGVIMDKSIALFNAEYKSQQASTLFEVIFDHVCKQEQVDQYLLDLIGVVCDLNEQINRCAVSALEVANA